MQFPRTLVEFQDQFPDEAHCWAYLRRARWPRGFECPRCGGRGSHFLASRRLDRCRTCRYQGSVTAGTVFHGTRVSLRVWLASPTLRLDSFHWACQFPWARRQLSQRTAAPAG